MNRPLAVAVGAMLLAGAARGQVTLPFYDGFNYGAGSNLGGNGPWVNSASPIKVGNTNLSYPGLLAGTGNNVTLVPTSSAARTYVHFASQTTGTVYFAFLLKLNTLPSAQRLIAYAFNSTSSSSAPHLGFFVTATGQLGVGISTSAPQFTSAPLSVGTPHLVVVAYTFGASDSAQVWINPSSLGGSAPAPDGSFTAGTHNAALSYFHWNTPSAGSGGGSYEVDELRIGLTYAAVTPGSGPGAAPSAPWITDWAWLPAGLVLRGTQGPPHGAYQVLSSTSLALPAEQWTVVGSGQFDAAGRFECTNPPGAAAWQFYRLRVGGAPGGLIPPSIVSQPQSQTAWPGQNVQFSVVATGSPPLSYQWFFNGNTPLAGGTNATLSISNVQSNDAGGYSVVVANAAGAVTSLVATLTISPPATNGDYYVSPTGNDANPGTMELPFATVAKAVSVAQPGNLIYVRGGTYYPTQTIVVNRSGAPDQWIKLWAYPGELPVLDFVNQPYGSSNHGFRFTTNASYWHVKGLEIARAGDNGIKVEGRHCIFELLRLRQNRDTGLQIGFSHQSVNPGGELAAYIQVINCDSWGNFDPDNNGADADGFAAKMHSGRGIVFIGCRAWENADDGWDLFESDASVVISNCWTWKSGLGQGNGNGFKLGGNGSGGDSRGTHYVYRSVAFGHRVNGFTQNSHKDGLVIEHCLSFSNGPSGYNYFMEGSLNSGKRNVFRNNVSIPRSGTNTGGFIADNNPIEQNNSWNLPVTANAADYLSLLESAAAAPRQPDGSLPAGFARLVAGSDLIDKGVDVGQPFAGAAPDLGPYEFQP
ncbi:MAG: immunoglobulin domain-containing protein [Verrucomicrobiales bacterium]|nr:immunoglobulin domain-containing protein [Verrucomicrobiales bacterium]